MKKLLVILSVMLLSVMAVNAQSFQRVLDRAVNDMNRQCPVALSNDVQLKRVVNITDYVIFDCNIKQGEEYIDSMKKKKKEEMKDAYEELLRTLAKGEDFAEFINLLVENEKGLKFRLNGKDTKKKLDITFTLTDLKSIIKR